jgi:hypothetical protein
MKCNLCWTPLHKQTVYITQCSHIFCTHVFFSLQNQLSAISNSFPRQQYKIKLKITFIHFLCFLGQNCAQANFTKSINCPVCNLALEW